MASSTQWIAGARPRTLPAAIAPVVAGVGIAYDHGARGWSIVAGRGLLALIVALALQVGVNYSNDYSDGVRGTDDDRVGPVRLVGQGLAAAAEVKRAAWMSFLLAAVAGSALVVITGSWWLVIVGAAAIVSAWLYTGGPRPYGYAGLGEVFVFVFFGLVAVCGTEYVVLGAITWDAVAMSVGIGALSCAILVANNLRDIPTDVIVGKRTLAVRLGDRRTRGFFLALVLVAAATAVVVAAIGLTAQPNPWAGGAGVAVLALILAIAPIRVVMSGASGRDLVAVLVGTGRVLLVYGVLAGLGAAFL